MAVKKRATSARRKSAHTKTHARKHASSKTTTRSRRTKTLSRSEAASVAGSAPHRCRGRECWYM